MGTLKVPGRNITESDLAEIRSLRAQLPEWLRYRLSVALAERWQWRNDAGRLKDMAARTRLSKLAARGLMDLPPPLWCPARKSPRLPPVSVDPPPVAIAAALVSIQPVRVAVVESLPMRRRILAEWTQLAVMVFGAAA